MSALRALLWLVWLTCVPALPPPPSGLSLKVVFPPADSVVSGTGLLMSVDVLLTDAAYSADDFMADHFPSTSLCIRLQLESAGDRHLVPSAPEPPPPSFPPTYDELKCNPLDTAAIEFSGLTYGRYSISTYLDSQTLSPRFALLENHKFETSARKPSGPTITDELSLSLMRSQRSLLQWYEEKRKLPPLPPSYPPPALSCSHTKYSSSFSSSSPPPAPPPFLVLGIKSSVDSFEHRQALRETWLNKASISDSARTASSLSNPILPPVCYYFIIGAVPPSSPKHDILTEALQLEQSYYHDLLLAPAFPVLDSYYTLVEKMTYFMRHCVKSHPSFSFLMMLDDDVYLSLSSLVDALRDSAPTTRFYAGQVWASQYGRNLRPQRDPKNRNYLSEDEYPLDTLPPFAIGPHYVLSRDMVSHIALNTPHILRGVGTLEDVSVGNWLLQLDVHPEHVPLFQNARNEPCSEGLVSFADLRPHAMRRVHDNVARGRKYCDGFAEDWIRNGASLTGFSDSFYNGFQPDPALPQAASTAPPTQHLILISPLPVNIVTGRWITFELSSPTSPALLSDITTCLSGNNGTLSFATSANQDGSIESDYKMCFSYEGAFDLQIPYFGSHTIKLIATRKVDDTEQLIAEFEVAVDFLPDALPSPIVDLQKLLLDADAEAAKDGQLVAQSIALRKTSPDRRPIRLALFFTTFDFHSPNGMFLKLGKHLARTLFQVEALGFGSTSTAVVSELSKMFVPAISIPSPSSKSYSLKLLSELKLLPSLANMSATTHSYLFPLISALSHVDVILVSNSRDDPKMMIMLEICRLVSASRPVPIVRVMDLPNADVNASVRVDAFIAPSHYVKLYKQRTEIERQRIPTKVVYPPALFKPAAAPGNCKNADVLVGYLGRLHPERFPGLFLHMARHILESSKEQLGGIDTTRLRFVFAGDGPAKAGLELLAAQLNITSRVSFIGNLDPDAVGDFLSSLSVYVNSRFIETFGISNVEAASSGAPIVAFASAGNLESIVASVGSHVLVSPDEDFRGLARAVIEVLRRRLHLVTCETTIAPSLSERFSLQRFVNGYSSVFLSLVGLSSYSTTTLSRGALLAPPPQSKSSSTISVGYSPGASYLSKLISSVFSSVFPSFSVVVSFVETDEHQVDVLVMSVLDSPPECKRSRSFTACEPWLVLYRQLFPSSKIVLVSGEPWDIHNADALGADVVLAGHTNPRHFPSSIPVIYFPNAATSFGERSLHAYGDLLDSEKRRVATTSKKTKFCAYMYYRCDRPERELFFDVLQARAAAKGLTVDALGACGGTTVNLSSAERESKKSKRFAESWHDDAVNLYEDYAFVVAFENVQEEGYFTEKLVNPFLAGSIPIYWGWSGANRIFNPEAFVDCNRFGTDLAACADYVVDLYASEGWQRMREKDAVLSRAVLEEEFGWPDGKGRLVRELAKAMWEAGGVDVNTTS